MSSVGLADHDFRGFDDNDDVIAGGKREVFGRVAGDGRGELLSIRERFFDVRHDLSEMNFLDRCVELVRALSRMTGSPLELVEMEASWRCRLCVLRSPIVSR